MRKRFEGTVDQLPSGRWRVRYRKDGKRLTHGTYSTRREAERELREIQSDIDRGTYIEQDKSRTLFRDFVAERYLPHQATRVKPSTYRNNESNFRLRLLPTFGHLRMAQIDPEAVEAWWDSLPPTVSRRNTYFDLSKCMTAAQRWGFIRVSPCIVADAGKNVAKARPRFEYGDVLDHADDLTRTTVLVAFSGHLRIGEVCGLDRRDYDASTGRLTVERQLSITGPKQTVETKTGNSRTVRLLGDGRDALDAWIRDRPMMPSAPLFTGPKGGRIDRAGINRGWNEAKSAAGLNELHFHDLKRIGLTLVARTGADVKSIMYRGGHTSITAAMAYQDASEERDDELAALADARLRRVL